ncbi:MAG: KOW domain-containing RNA-binding protein [Oscillospiraceae bacterium]|nr:KOW domain-containing RNA-binding protein [Oscillospiraceae bacterium]
MDIKIGTVVKSNAGHDKDSFYVVVGYQDGKPLIADGRRRKLEKPKAKNPKHISKTNTTVQTEELTNKKIRTALHSFNFPGIGE